MVDKSVKNEAERIAKEATRQAMIDPLMPYYITVAPFIEAAILQARSQAFDESAKIADGYAVEPDPDEQDPYDEWEMGNRSAAKRISQAIRQHSQKGRDNDL